MPNDSSSLHVSHLTERWTCSHEVHSISRKTLDNYVGDQHALWHSRTWLSVTVVEILEDKGVSAVRCNSIVVDCA